MSEPNNLTFTDVLVLRQLPDLCPHVELDGSTEGFRTYLNDLADRIAVLAPPPFNPFEFKVEGVGEVIEPDDPRHPKYQST
jgi:hypothetical protein